MPVNELQPSVAYLDIFRVYYSSNDDNSTYKLLNNRKQRIELRVEILARDSNHAQVMLTQEQLASIRLVQVDTNGNMMRELSHDVSPDVLTDWSTYFGTLGYHYNESAFSRKIKESADKESTLSMTLSETITVPFPERGALTAGFEQCPTVTVFHDNTPQGAQIISLWVATAATQDIRLAARFQTFLSSTTTNKSHIVLQPKTFNQNAVNINREDVRYPEFSADNRVWNYYLSATYGPIETPIAIWYQWMDKAIWWDRGEAGESSWFTEWAYCIARNKGEISLRKGINEHVAEKKLPGATDREFVVDTAPHMIYLPRENACVVVSVLRRNHRKLFWMPGEGEVGMSKRADDNLSTFGDLTDEFGNTYKVTFKFASNKRDFELIKR
ncbi:hypothetical protein ACQRKX_004898 [Enterobacter cloacae]